MSERFDDVSRILASGIPRRDAVRLLVTTLVGGTLAPGSLWGRSGSTAAMAGGAVKCLQNNCLAKEQAGGHVCEGQTVCRCAGDGTERCGLVSVPGEAPFACCCPEGTFACSVVNEGGGVLRTYCCPGMTDCCQFGSNVPNCCLPTERCRDCKKGGTTVDKTCCAPNEDCSVCANGKILCCTADKVCCGVDPRCCLAEDCLLCPDGKSSVCCPGHATGDTCCPTRTGPVCCKTSASWSDRDRQKCCPDPTAPGFSRCVPSSDPVSCTITGTGTNASGQKYIQISVQEPTIGVASITTVEATNATVSIPSFTPGTFTPIVVTATKINQALSATVKLEVCPGCGCPTCAGPCVICDPVLLEVSRDPGKPTTHTFTGLPQAEHHIHVTNAAPGVTNLRVAVNGRNFQLGGLKDGQSVAIDVASAMHPGNANTIELTALGKPGGSAAVLIHD